MIIKRNKNAIKNYFEDSSGVLGSSADLVAIVENECDTYKFIVEMFESKTPVIL
ncbi:MAG: hypothetical protein LBB92_02235 [Endomicrobium sp.]|jgi:D-lactate dehydrogenase (cytochrome)|nr:hypothetical protein [Endomicrobium sp.]